MELHIYQFKAMGGPCELRLETASQTHADTTARLVRAEIDRLEAKYSRYREDSYLSRINSSAGTGATFSPDPETAALLQHADTLWQQSGGMFDISSGNLRRAWDFKSGRLPRQAEIDRLLTQVGWPRVQWDGAQLCLPIAGMELDFGGLVKEYACDAAVAVLRANNVVHGLVEMAGDIAVSGPRASGAPWLVGIRSPARPEQALAAIPLAGGALASSGDYERCMLIDGVRYSHLLNPHTGWPVRGLASVSVQADQCLVAGSVATLALLKSESEGLQWLAQLGLAYLAVDHAQQCHGAIGDVIAAR